MGCSNARLLVQTPLTEANPTAATSINHPLTTTLPTSNDTAPTCVSADVNASTTRMHLTGVDLVVERNGTYTLLLTPKTHKQLMPYVLRKKRFRILVDKARSEVAATSIVHPPFTSYDLAGRERIMESKKELKLAGKKNKKQAKGQVESTVESVQQAATEELDKAKARFVGGRSIDRGNPEDDDENIHSDDEGMIEEIVTTVEEDKDLECKVKKKIETKKTVAEDPETHNKITKVVKTEVTEITRTITINDQHDLERAKRELGIDDVNKLLPSTQIIYNLPSSYHSSASWIDHPRLTQVQEKYYEPANEIVTSGDFPSDSPIKQHSPAIETTTRTTTAETKSEQSLADATTVGRGAVVETISSPSTAITSLAASAADSKSVEVKKKKKSGLNLCSCTRSTATDQDEEHRKHKAATIVEQKSKQKKKASVTNTNTLLPGTVADAAAATPTEQIQGEQLISADVKELIANKKPLMVDYIHSKVFLPAKLFTSAEQDGQARKISSRILDLLRYDRCSSWAQLHEQVKGEYDDQLTDNLYLQPMIKTYEDLLTSKQSNLLNTFATIHQEKDMKTLPENSDYITIVQTHLTEREKQANLAVMTKPFAANIEDTLQRLQQRTESDQKVIDDGQEKQQPLQLGKEIDMADDIDKGSPPIYNEEQLSKMFANISQDKPITLAEAIAYQHIDLEDPKLGLSNETIQCIKHLFRPLTSDDDSTLNLIRIKRSGQPLSDFNLAESNAFEKFHLSEPFIYQLQQSFEPTLDFHEKQFRSLAEAIVNHKDEYSNLQFDIGRTLIPAGDMKESSTNDFSQSDSGYSMTTTTQESLASKLKNEFETITEPIAELDKSLDPPLSSTETRLDIDERALEVVQQITANVDIQKDSTQVPTTSLLTKEKASSTPIYVKKRKSSGLLSCFRSKKSKASSDQHGQPTLSPVKTTVASEAALPAATSSPEEKPTTNYALLPDGKRIYIDLFHARPGLDMSYQPKDFDTRFVLPATKPATEDDRSDTIDTPQIHLESRSTTIDSADIHRELVEDISTAQSEPILLAETTGTRRDSPSPTIELSSEKVDEQHVLHLEPRGPTAEPVDLQADIVEPKPIVHLEARPDTVEPIVFHSEATPIVIPLTRSEESTVVKSLVNLHGAPVDLPEVVLVKPGPLPTLPLAKDKTLKSKVVSTAEKPVKVKKSTGGLCASCFGAKAAEKKRKAPLSDTVKAPIEAKKEDVVVSTFSTTAAVEPAITTVEVTPSEVLPSLVNNAAILPAVYIDNFQERHLEQTVEELPKLEDRLDATIENLVLTEEPHYQLPSGEPVPPVVVENEYTLPDPNTYDIPRPLKTPSMENIQIHTEEKLFAKEISVSPPLSDVKVTTEEFTVSKDLPEKPQIQSIISTETASATMPNVDIKDSSTKGSFTLPTKKSKNKKEKVKKEKKEKKSGLFGSVFRQSDRKSKTPGLDLPPVERDLTANNPLRDAHRHDSDPLRVPHVDLPKPDVALPSFERPEVNMTSGQLQQSTEFAIPTVDLPPIPDLQLPIDDKRRIESDGTELKIPNVQLPELQLSAEEQEQFHLPEFQLNTHKKELVKEVSPDLPVIPQVKLENEVEHFPTIETGLALASPVDDLLGIQVNQKEFPIETDYAVKLESVQVEHTIPDLPRLPSEDPDIQIKPELLSTEQKYTITGTHFVPPPELTLSAEKQTTDQLDLVPLLPNLSFQLPSIEPVSLVSKDVTVPSFEDGVPQVAAPAVAIENLPVKSLDKQVIEPKVNIKKKSSTLGLCSCFGSKAHVQKEKTQTLAAPKTIAAPKADLPAVEMPVQSSSIASTLKTKGVLRAPTNDLPPVSFNSVESEPVRLPAIAIHEKKRAAPKKPVVPDEKKAAEVIISPEAVVPSTDILSEEELLVSPAVTEIEVNEEIQLRPPSPAPVRETVVTDEIPVRPATPFSIVEKQAVEETLAQSASASSTIEKQQTTENVPIESASSTATVKKEKTQEIKKATTAPKRLPSFEIKAPALNIPDLDLSGPPKSEAYLSLSSSKKPEEPAVTTATTTIAPIQSRSDSGLEAIISSHLQGSSTFSTNPTVEDLHQHTSISSGLGSEIIDSINTKGYTLPDVPQENTTTEPKRESSTSRHDFTRKITMTEDSRSKLIFRQTELKKCLESEISKSIDDFDAKKDQKTLTKILTHAIDLIKDKKVSTYPELKQKLIVEHKNDAFIVDPVVRSLYCTMENQGLDNIDTPEFPLAIRDMVRLPAKQTFDTVTQLNKSTSEETQRIAPEPSSTTSCLTCGRGKSKKKAAAATAVATSSTGLLDERRRLQLNTHRNELGTVLRDHIQSTQPAIRNFPENPKEVEKIIRKSLASVTQPKALSYEQIRNELKTEYKQTFYLVDPIIDIVRDTFDHCDITQMNEKINLDILDSNIAQTAQLYNQVHQQNNLLTPEESNLLKSNQLTWVNAHLIDSELKEKKITSKQNKELSRILARAMNILSLNLLYTWDELNSQLRREFPKAHDQCDRAVELIKQAQKNGLLVMTQSPNSASQDVTSINIIQSNGKRRASSLITDRARQNLKNNRNKIVASLTALLYEHNKPLYTQQQIESYLSKAFHHLEEQKSGQFKDYNDLKTKLKKDFKSNHENLIEQIVDVIEQAHASNQFDDVDKPEVQTLLKDRLAGKPLVIKEMYVSLPPRAGAYGSSKNGNDEGSRYLSTSPNGDGTLNSSTSSHRVARGLSWREANERARILFYRGKHPAIHYDEQAAGFDVRMLLETTAGGTQEIPVTDSDVHELLNSCGVQWDGVNIISLVDHSEDVVRAAEQAALKVIREKGLVDLRTPPATRNKDDSDEPSASPS